MRGTIEFEEGAADIICTDGTIANCETFTESMEGIVLADGIVYVHFLDVTVKLSLNGNAQPMSESLDEIESELQKTGAEGWRRVSVEEILTLEHKDIQKVYAYVRQIIFEYSGSGKKPEGGSGSSGGDSPEQGGSTTTENVMSGIRLADGTLYVLIDGVTVVVKDGKVEKSEIEYGEITSAIKKGELEDWTRLNDDQIRNKYGMEIYEEIISIAKEFGGKK